MLLVPERTKATVESSSERRKLPGCLGQNVNPAGCQHQYDHAKPGEHAAQKAAKKEAKAAKTAALCAKMESVKRELDCINALEDEEDEEAEKTYHQLSATKQKHAEEHAEDTSGDEFGSMSIDSDKAYQEHSITKSNSTTSTELVRIGHIW